MQTVLLAGTDVIQEDIRYPESFSVPLRQGAIEGSNAPTVDLPTFVLIHNSAGQHDLETYRFYLAWDIYIFENEMIPLKKLHDIANLLSLYESNRITVPPQYANLPYGIHSVNSDLDETPEYYY